MEPISEKNQVLSAIEQSIQNALSLVDFKSLLGGRRHGNFYSVDDPIVSLHLQDTGVYKTSEEVESNNNKLLDALRPSDEVDYSSHQQPEALLNNFKHINNSSFHEPISLPFSENPISKSIGEMQRVLNARGNGFPETSEPSPAEILNQYSENLGICISCNGSPRGGDSVHPQHETNNDINTNKYKRDNNTLKQPKSKFTKKTKLDNKKEQSRKPDMSTSKENKLRDLINIYGGSEKMRKPYTDLSLYSRSEETRKISPSTLTNLNDLSKVSSIPSRKSRIKNKKPTNKNDVYLNDVVIEKSSRLTSKRKSNPRTNLSNLKKVNLKRRLKLNPSNVDFELKLNRNLSFSSKENKHSTNTVKSSTNTNRQLQLKNKASTQIKKRLYQCPQNYKKNKLTNNVNETCFNVSSNKKLYNEPDNRVKPNDLVSLNDHCNKYDKICKLNSSEQEMCLLNKKASTESTNLKNHILYHKSEHVDRNDFNFVSQDSQNDHLKHETYNEDFVSKSTQLHYALPTQSSRSKEVERFLNGHYQHLPFVIGQSTSKSHNLWVNIQEALSLIKQKLQQPTETQNNTLKDCVEFERPPSVFSNLTTKTIKKPHLCPALRSDGLYNIPEGNLEIEETGVNSWEDHPECIKANADSNYVRSRCSCLAQPVMNYKNVLRQIFGVMSEGASHSSQAMNGVRGDALNDQGGDSYITELKKALVRFTQDLEEMNNKYEEMLLDPNSSKEELQHLEVKLENKEEEIKEIIARFNEVKEFNARAHLEDTKSRARLCNLDAFKSTTSIRLAQTLRRVQQFKESMKSRPSVPFLSRQVHILSTY